MPSIIVIAGPNGAGKTTFANEFLSAERTNFEFVNADEIARDSSSEADGPARNDIAAARIMLERVDHLVAVGADFVLETTLATLSYARKIPEWRKRGYYVSLIYLRLESVDQSLRRVRKRVEAGGHGIPDDAVRRRFDKSARYFEMLYKPIVDEWHVWESREGSFVMIESSDDQ